MACLLGCGCNRVSKVIEDRRTCEVEANILGSELDISKASEVARESHKLHAVDGAQRGIGGIEVGRLVSTEDVPCVVSSHCDFAADGASENGCDASKVEGTHTEA